jgi:capsid protein
LRRWDEATIRAAEIAALFAAYMTTQDASIVGDNPSQLDPEELEIEAGTITVGPPGYKIEQVQPQHPSENYGEFKKSKLQDCGAGVDMPYNVLAADSSGHNYASGRLDWQGLIRSIKVMRSWIDAKFTRKVFGAWWKEVRFLPEFKGAPPELPIEFRYPGFEHVDPQKEAAAAEIRIRNNLQTHADWYAQQGKDWREEFAQLAREKQEAKALGIVSEVENDAGKPGFAESDGAANDE